MAKRIFDLTISSIAIILMFLPSLFIFLLIKLTSPGPAIYWSNRIGVKGTIFMMPKFRTMKINTPEVATNCLDNASQYVTPIGLVLRKLSLDELPQLISVFLGQMSIVGPRPALHKQRYLIEKRKEMGVDNLRPGLTGWAQVNGRDNISIEAKLQLDKVYLERQSIFFDIKIMALTVLVILKLKDVSH